MNIYQSFLKFTSNEYYDDNWRIFALEFPELIEKDNNLQKFLAENIFIQEKWIEIKDEIKYSLEEELLWLPYLDYNLLDENSLIKKVISIANNMLKASLFKGLSDDLVDTDNLRQTYNLLEEDQAIQFKADPEEINGLDDNIILDDLKLIHRNLRNFELDKNNLFKRLSNANWDSEIKPTLIKQIPIVKQVDYFDPAIYTLIKNNPDLIRTLDWRVFEEMLADMLKTFGYSIELTRKTKDGGIDVIAIKGDSNFGMHKYILQAKRYTDSVQVSPIRELLFLHSEHGASKSCLATTSTFTKGAWELADKYKWTLELKERAGILNWIDQVIELKKKH